MRGAFAWLKDRNASFETGVFLFSSIEQNTEIFV